MLIYITIEIPGNLNQYWLPTYNIFLRKVICEVDTLTLQKQDTLNNKHQSHYGPLDHCRILFQGFIIQSLLEISYHTIPFLEFTGSPIGFPLALEIPCPWKYIVIINIRLWNLVPRKSDVVSNRLPWNHLSCVPSQNNCNLIIHSLLLFIQMFTWQGLHLRCSIRIMDPIFESISFSHMAYRWYVHTIFCLISAINYMIQSVPPLLL